MARFAGRAAQVQNAVVRQVRCVSVAAEADSPTMMTKALNVRREVCCRDC
jgi:hypothetical protein